MYVIKYISQRYYNTTMQNLYNVPVIIVQGYYALYNLLLFLIEYHYAFYNTNL